MVWAALPSLTCLFPHLSLDPPLLTSWCFAQVWAQRHCPAPKGEGANTPEQAQEEEEEGGAPPPKEQPTLAGSKHNLAKPN